MMNVLVCGGRDFDDKDYLFKMLDIILDKRKVTIIHGGASGADSLAKEWAKSRNHNHIEFLAEWGKHGIAAGPLRNAKMLEEGQPDLVIAFRGGNGTQDMATKARWANVPLIFPRK